MIRMKRYASDSPVDLQLRSYRCEEGMPRVEIWPLLQRLERRNAAIARLEQFRAGQTHIGRPKPAKRRFGNPFQDCLGSTEPVKTKSALGLTWGERFDDAALGDPAMPALSDQRV